MDHSITPEDLRSFRRQFEASTLSQVAARAVSKTSPEDVCYDSRSARRMTHKFSVDIPTMPALNQKNSGRCWLFAAMNLLREKLGKELNVEEVELSETFLYFYDHLEKANTFLEQIIETADAPLDDRFVAMRLSAPQGDGGWWEYFVGLCKKYGVCPKDAMPETRQSGNSEAMNTLLNMQLRRDALQLRKLAAAGSTALQQEKKKMLERVYNLLAIFLGDPPEVFDFEYVDRENRYHADRGLTPGDFYDKYLGVDLDSIVSILNAPVEAIPYYRTYYTAGEESICGAYRAVRLNLPMEEFKAAVIRQLQAGELVWFVCDCDYYGSLSEGIWDTALYDFETPFGLDLSMDKGELLEYRQCSLNHAMVLTGVNLDENGQPTRWKIENSWGDERGKKGYYVCSDTWFDEYVFQAAIEKEYLGDAAKLCEQEPIVLEPWDPMGTLAD